MVGRLLSRMPQLREFVYLDNESLDSNLSSLGKGLPSEITHADADRIEKGGQASAGIPGIGGKGNYLNIGREEVETTLDITAPYRFQDLLNEIQDRGIEIKENPDPRDLSRADLVRINGTVHPMSTLKFEMALSAFNIFTDEEFNENLRKLGEDPVVTQTEADQMKAIIDVMKRVSRKQYPLRIELDDMTYCTTLHDANMRQSIHDAFGENQEYVLFGRVKRHVPGDEEWKPVNALNIIEKYIPGDVGDEFMKGLRDSPDDIQISIKNKDLAVQGHTAVIDPIAMYW